MTSCSEYRRDVLFSRSEVHLYARSLPEKVNNSLRSAMPISRINRCLHRSLASRRSEVADRDGIRYKRLSKTLGQFAFGIRCSRKSSIPSCRFCPLIIHNVQESEVIAILHDATQISTPFDDVRQIDRACSACIICTCFLYKCEFCRYST